MSSFTAPDNTAPQNGDGGRSSSTPIPLPTITLSGVYLRNILDFILILQACLDRKLPFIKHRPKGEGIATSGSVYVYETQSSRITRWTDDKTLKWSPSRVLNSSLVYREIDISTDVQHGFQETYDSTDVQHGSHETYDSVLTGAHTEPSKYKYKSLMKKTMTFRIQGKEYHVINYYSLKLEDANGLALLRPIDMDHLHGPFHQDFACEKSNKLKRPFMEEMDETDPQKPWGYIIYDANGWLDRFKNPPSPPAARENHFSSQHQTGAATGVPTSMPTQFNAGQFTSHPNTLGMHPEVAFGRPPMVDNTYPWPNAYRPQPGNGYADTQPMQAQPQQVPVYPQYQPWTNPRSQTPATQSNPNNSNPGALGTPYAPPSNTSGESIGSFQVDIDPNLFNPTGAPGTLFGLPPDAPGPNIWEPPIDPNLFNYTGAPGTSLTLPPDAPRPNIWEPPIDPNLFDQGALGTPNAPPPDTPGQNIGEPQIDPLLLQDAHINELLAILRGPEVDHWLRTGQRPGQDPDPGPGQVQPDPDRDGEN